MCMNKSLLINGQFRKTVLLGYIYKWQQLHLDNDCSVRVYQPFVAIFQKYFVLWWRHA